MIFRELMIHLGHIKLPICRVKLKLFLGILLDLYLSKQSEY